MTHQLWTRIFVASLIFFGDGALTSEVNNRSNVDSSFFKTWKDV